MALVTAGEHHIIGQDGGDRDLPVAGQPLVERAEIRFQRHLQQLIETVDDELILLEIVDPVRRFQHAFERPADAVGAGAVQREQRFAMAGNDAGAIDRQALF